MHLKRNKMPKFWPIPRKGTKNIANPNHNQKDSMPLVVILRDILNQVKNKKELKRALHEKKVSVNHKDIHETNYPVSLFDVITLKDSNKSWKAILSVKKKMEFIEVKASETKDKLYKVIGKRTISKNQVQINLMHGENITTKEKVNVGDSILLDLKTKKIEKVIKMEKGKHATIIKGKHIGNNGKIEEIMERGGKQIAKIINEDKEKINVWTENIIVS